MYITSVSLFMFIFPILSVIIDAFVLKNPLPFMLIVGKWFVFWAVGVRLLTAGVRQIAKPNLTTEGILGIKDKASWLLARELGFYNFAVGLAGIIALGADTWRPAVAFVAGLFLLLAGLQHITKKRNFEENIAMYSDILIALVLFAYLCFALTTPPVVH